MGQIPLNKKQIEMVRYKLRGGNNKPEAITHQGAGRTYNAGQFTNFGLEARENVERFSDEEIQAMHSEGDLKKILTNMHEGGLLFSSISAEQQAALHKQDKGRTDQGSRPNTAGSQGRRGSNTGAGPSGTSAQ